MEVYLIAFATFAAVIAAMAIGVIVSGRRIRGTCGGLNAWTDGDGRPICDACADCPEQKQNCELEDAAATSSARR